MQFELSEEQIELGSFLRELLENKSDSASVRKTIESGEPYDKELWSILAEQIGAHSLAIPEEFGGTGFSTRETHIVLEELGRSLTPSPYLGSVCIAAQAILESNDVAASERLLPAIAAGESVAALAWADAQGGWNPARVNVAATFTEGSSPEATLSGEIPFVLDGDYADVIIAIAQTHSGPALFEIKELSSTSRVKTATLDQTLNLATIRFDETPAHLMSSNQTMFENVRNHALTAISAVQLGTAQRAFEMTVAYSKQRTQFGRLIGSFQALKHRMADMYVLLETARTTSYAAAWGQAEKVKDQRQLAILAKATGNDTLTHIAGETIQMHGGIAITWEHDAHMIFKRAHSLGELFGSSVLLRQEAAHLV